MLSGVKIIGLTKRVKNSRKYSRLRAADLVFWQEIAGTMSPFGFQKWGIVTDALPLRFTMITYSVVKQQRFSSIAHRQGFKKGKGDRETVISLHCPYFLCSFSMELGLCFPRSIWHGSSEERENVCDMACSLSSPGPGARFFF